MISYTYQHFYFYPSFLIFRDFRKNSYESYYRDRKFYKGEASIVIVSWNVPDEPTHCMLQTRPFSLSSLSFFFKTNNVAIHFQENIGYYKF